MVDPALVSIWLNGWALARGAPPPVWLGACWRVDVGLPDQMTRYVFPATSPELAELAAAITEPWVYLKALVPRDVMAAALPPGWVIDPPRVMMVRGSLPDDAPKLPTGYRLILAPDAPVASAHILSSSGEIAAKGQVVRSGEHAIFDSIRTEKPYRRLGLGRALMLALAGIARGHGAQRGVLTATEEGRALYETLSWQVCAPYASAVIPDIQRRNQEAG